MKISIPSSASLCDLSVSAVKMHLPSPLFLEVKV